MVKGLEENCHEEWLRSLGLLSLEETEEDFTAVYNLLMRESGVAGVKYNSIANSYRCDMERNYFILIGVMELPLFDHMLSAPLGTSCPKKGQH
ncbi:hypothetical protein TURU_053881 [Turdus rufiventris]|nr:hypothetical protein TURU_053881 [Turdus rufiventris]